MIFFYAMKITKNAKKLKNIASLFRRTKRFQSNMQMKKQNQTTQRYKERRGEDLKNKEVNIFKNREIRRIHNCS